MPQLVWILSLWLLISVATAAALGTLITLARSQPAAPARAAARRPTPRTVVRRPNGTFRPAPVSLRRAL